MTYRKTCIESHETKRIFVPFAVEASACFHGLASDSKCLYVPVLRENEVIKDC